MEIFSIVARYLHGEATLADVENWVVPRLGQLLASPRSTAYSLAGTIELGLAELAAGDIDEEGFRALIREFLLTHRSPTFDLRATTTYSCASNSRVPTPSPYLAFGIRPDGPVRYERIPLGEAA